MIWLHHPPTSEADIFSDSDDETTDCGFTGSRCSVCGTVGTAYTLLDDRGYRYPNPYVKFLRSSGPDDNFKPPDVSIHLDCRQLYREFKEHTTKVDCILHLALSTVLIQDVAEIVAEYMLSAPVPLFDAHETRLEIACWAGMKRQPRGIITEYAEPVDPFFEFVGHMARFIGNTSGLEQQQSSRPQQQGLVHES